MIANKLDLEPKPIKTVASYKVTKGLFFILFCLSTEGGGYGGVSLHFWGFLLKPQNIGLR